jgi:hypothetical protein
VSSNKVDETPWWETPEWLERLEMMSKDPVLACVLQSVRALRPERDHLRDQVEEFRVERSADDVAYRHDVEVLEAQVKALTEENKRVKDALVEGVRGLKRFGGLGNHGHRRPGSSCHECRVVNAMIQASGEHDSLGDVD